MADALMKQFTQTGGDKTIIRNGQTVTVPDDYVLKDDETFVAGGRRRRHSKHHKGNSWLAHVKATMKLNRGKSFKQVLKLAKKSYKKSQSSSSSQSGGKGKGTRKGQYGGSGGKVAGVGASASPYV